jgi:hypothetical protein
MRGGGGGTSALASLTRRTGARPGLPQSPAPGAATCTAARSWFPRGGGCDVLLARAEERCRREQGVRGGLTCASLLVRARGARGRGQCGQGIASWFDCSSVRSGALDAAERSWHAPATRATRAAARRRARPAAVAARRAAPSSVRPRIDSPAYTPNLTRIPCTSRRKLPLPVPSRAREAAHKHTGPTPDCKCSALAALALAFFIHRVARARANRGRSPVERRDPHTSSTLLVRAHPAAQAQEGC